MKTLLRSRKEESETSENPCVEVSTWVCTAAVAPMSKNWEQPDGPPSCGQGSHSRTLIRGPLGGKQPKHTQTWMALTGVTLSGGRRTQTAEQSMTATTRRSGKPAVAGIDHQELTAVGLWEKLKAKGEHREHSGGCGAGYTTLSTCQNREPHTPKRKV